MWKLIHERRQAVSWRRILLIAGESLLNDAAAIVLFTLLLAMLLTSSWLVRG